MHKSWVVVANRSEAIIYERALNSIDLTEVRKLEFENGDKKIHELVTDRPDMNFTPTGGHRRTDKENDPSTQEMLRSATELADTLDKARAESQYESLDLIADPKMLGVIRQRLSPETSRILGRQVDKNIVEFEPDKIKQYLQ